MRKCVFYTEPYSDREGRWSISCSLYKADKDPSYHGMCKHLEEDETQCSRYSDHNIIDRLKELEK